MMNEDLASRWTRAVPTLRPSGLRVAYLRAEIGQHPPDDLALAINRLAASAEQANPVAREVLAAMLLALADPASAKLVIALRCLAGRDALLSLGRILRGKSREPVPDETGTTTALGPETGAPPAPRSVVPRSPDGRALTLGERRALARRPSRAVLDKLLRDPHPMVIRNLLSNPRLTEMDVIRMAAQRPALPEVTAEIARHPTFSQRSRVRMAIIQNPGSPPEISIPLVSLLIRPELEQVVAAADIPARVRAAATELLERRPPVPNRGAPGLPQ